MSRTVEKQDSYVRYVHKRCAKKERHLSKSEAQAAGRHHISRGAVGALWVYQCIYCQGWHLTRRDNGADYAVHVVIARVAA
jgi:hypothetical protein